MDQNIQVIIRPRKLNNREQEEGASECITFDVYDNRKLTLDNSKVFNYDVVLDPLSQQDEVFNKVGLPLVSSCIDGYNGCIFAYGQTGSGKTHTMMGRLDEGGKQLGIQPRVLQLLFAKAGALARDIVIKCSYLEIYNENIYDLLSKKKDQTLILREDIKKGTYVQGLTEEIIENLDQASAILGNGANSRHVASTQMNSNSSRSHSVFIITFESKEKQSEIEIIRASKLNFVDLAGSERQKSAGTTGQRLKEGACINKSLTILGNVISSLVEQANGLNLHIPYRDSKLTHLLKDSLGGNSKTIMIAAISVASTHLQETLSTLKFAQRVKLIRNHAQVNEQFSGNQMKRLELEITQLKEELQIYKSMPKVIDQKDAIGILLDDIRQLIQRKSKSSQFDENHPLSSRLSELEQLLSGDKIQELMEQLEEKNNQIIVITQQLATCRQEMTKQITLSNDNSLISQLTFEKSELLEKIQNLEQNQARDQNQIQRQLKQLQEYLLKDQQQYAQIMGLESKCEHQERKIRELEKQMRDNQELYDLLFNQQKQQMEQQQNLLSAKIKELKDLIESQEFLQHHHETEIANLKNQNAILIRRIEDYQAEILKFEISEKEKLTNREYDLNTQLRVANEQVKHLQDLNNQLNDMMRSQQEQFEGQIEEYQIKINELEQIIEIKCRLEEENKRFLVQIEALNMQVIALTEGEKENNIRLRFKEHQYELLKEEKKGFVEEIGLLNEKIEELIVEKEQLEQEKDFIEKNEEKQQNQIKEGERERIVLMEENKNLKNTITTLVSTISNVDKSTINLNELEQKATAVILEYKVNRQTSKELKSSLRIQVNRLKEENSQLEIENKRQSDEIFKLNIKYEEKNQQTEALQKSLTESQNEYFKLKSSYQLIQNDQINFQQTFNQREFQNDKEISELKKIKQELSLTNKKIEEEKNFLLYNINEIWKKLSNFIGDKLMLKGLHDPKQQQLFRTANQFKKTQIEQLICYVEIVMIEFQKNEAKALNNQSRMSSSGIYQSSFFSDKLFNRQDQPISSLQKHILTDRFNSESKENQY